MSKMGQVNFDLQEQAEALGFESVQEALDNGYRAFMNIDGNNRLIKMEPRDYTEAVTAELVAAHQQYEADKRRILNNLEMLLNDTPYTVYRKVLSEAIEFFKQKEI